MTSLSAAPLLSITLLFYLCFYRLSYSSFPQLPQKCELRLCSRAPSDPETLKPVRGESQQLGCTEREGSNGSRNVIGGRTRLYIFCGLLAVFFHYLLGNRKLQKEEQREIYEKEKEEEKRISAKTRG